MAEILLELMGLAYDKAAIAIKWYLTWIARFLILSFIALALTLVFSQTGIVWVTQVTTFSLLTLMFIFSWIVLPVLILYEVIINGRSGLAVAVGITSGLSYWLLHLYLFFVVFPIWDYPKAVPIILLISLILGISFVRFDFGLSPVFGYLRALVVGSAVLAIVLVPDLKLVGEKFLEKTRRGVRAGMLQPGGIEYTPGVAIYAAGKPLYWYSPDDCRHLYDSPGNDSRTNSKLLPFTREQEKGFRECFEADRKAEAEKRKQGQKSVIPSEKPVEPQGSKPESQSSPQEEPETALFPRITRTSRFNLNPDERNTWGLFRAGGDADVEIFADGVICWDNSHPEGCVAADGASWTPAAINAAELNKYPASNERFLCVLGRINDGPVFKIGVRKKLEIKKDDQLSFLLNVPSDSNIYLWQGLSLEIRETEK